jgi:iron complex outermembrane recepter protein
MTKLSPFQALTVGRKVRLSALFQNISGRSRRSREGTNRLWTRALLLTSLLLSPARAFAQSADEHVSPPLVLEQVDPEYPAVPTEPGAHVDVGLTVVIDEEGHVVDVEVVTTAGTPFDDAAVAAVRKWTFTPAHRGERPIRSKIRVAVHFAPKAPAPIAAIDSKPWTPVTSVEGTAETAVDTTPAESETDTVHVVGRSTPPSRGASDFNLRVGELARVPRKNAGELLKLAPGILLTNEGGEGHAQQVFLRGFDAREGQDIEFSVDGVPINEAGNLHANGYADSHFIIPELVTTLRVVEGPFDPRQGNFAVAGSADYQLGLTKRGLTAKYTLGSFGTQRLLLTWGPASLDTHTFGGAELYRTTGFGQNRDARRATAMGQYEGRVGERGTYRVSATAYTADYRSAGLLRDDDWGAGRKSFYDTYDTSQGGQSSRFSLAAAIETRAGRTTFQQQLFVIQRGMRVKENFTGFLLDVQEPTQEIHAQRGDLIDRDISSSTMGGRGFARTRFAFLDLTQETELGYFARYDAVDAQQTRIQASNSVPYHLDVDLASKLANVGLYMDANLRPLKWLNVRGGLRADLFSFDVLNRCAATSVRKPSPLNPPGDDSCLAQQDFGRYREKAQRQSTASSALMPRAAILVGPFYDIQFSASYGRGVRSVDPSYVYEDVATPFASVDAYEAGAVFTRTVLGAALSARTVVFQTHVDRDLVFSETAGRNTLANGTIRTGWLAAARWTGTWFDESANVTLVRSTFDDTKLLVPYVPDVVVRSDTAVFATLPWRIGGESLRGALSAGVSFVGRRALPYGERSNAIFTIDASATLSWRGVEIGLEATNLTDRRYRLGEYNFTSDWQAQLQPTLLPTRHFAAGAPRAVFATLAVTWEGT